MAIMRKAFQMFDTTKSGYIDVLKISTILNTMGQLFDDSELNSLIEENDPECNLISKHIKNSLTITTVRWIEKFLLGLYSEHFVFDLSLT